MQPEVLAYNITTPLMRKRLPILVIFKYRCPILIKTESEDDVLTGVVRGLGGFVVDVALRRLGWEKE